jgi:hypothetical protein
LFLVILKKIKMSREQILNEAVAKIVNLSDGNLLRVKEFSSQLLKEQESNIAEELSLLAVHGGSFDFLLNEPDLYTIDDCKELYDAEHDALIPNPNYIKKYKSQD